MVQQGTRQTVAQFEAFIALPENRDRNFELIDGEIIEKISTEEHTEIASQIRYLVGNFLKEHPIGHVNGVAQYQLPGDPHNIVRPDISVVAVPRLPDLVIEVKSPDDMFRQMRKKAEYYLEHGSRLVWLVFPEQRLIEVYVPDSDLRILHENDTLDGGDVLPGFSLKVTDIFKSP